MLEKNRPLVGTMENGDVCHDVPVIDLSSAPGERAAWGRPALLVYLWAFVELLVVTNPLQISSRLRVAVLRLLSFSGLFSMPRVRTRHAEEKPEGQQVAARGFPLEHVSRDNSFSNQSI